MFLGGLLPFIILFYVNYIVPKSPIYSGLKKARQVIKMLIRNFSQGDLGYLKLFIFNTISWGLY